ncbi:MAG: AraC family transcriptional regulator [Flavobacteriales bacterium]|jgi:AraC family transcriptional regulator
MKAMSSSPVDQGKGLSSIIIRNMVCDRCKAAVRAILEDVSLPIRGLELGEVELMRPATEAELIALGEALRSQGFELVQGREAVTIARIKAAIVQLVHHEGDPATKVKMSEHLSGALQMDFSGLSALFSEVEGVTIEHYFLLQRIERVKELVRYGELTISEIAFAVGFSSAAHLSGQFKKLTGMSPTAFRKLGGPRTSLDQVG